ncbi:cholecystokinin-like [Megalops cyprinoides]|uniref:cholecystokinin-like n=1 Tax=Megalops cyprinoides TaxID=118141 RepID=UPI001864231C|nr:cholecystokinin-like [Megalops cyprinoides]
MNSGICICILLAALSSSCLGRPRAAPSRDDGRPAAPQPDTGLPEHRRPARSAPLASPVKPFPQLEEGTDAGASLSELLARLMSRKGSYRRNSTMNSRSSGLSANHRIKDRDYMGWMDFGRRSAEEYEYSS